MPKLDITSATSSDLTNAIEDYSIDAMNTDGVGNQDETEYQNSKWGQQWGYFNQVPDLKSAIILKAIWNVGKGYTCDAKTAVILDHINGWGKDTFDDILFNLEIVRRIGGDFFAEIMRADDGTLINLKPLDPGSMKIIVDRKGMIKRYEQTNKISDKNKSVVKFEPKDILHISNNRLADQIHGISDIDAVEETILADEQSFDDLKKIIHWQSRPIIMFKLWTDDQGKIDAFIAKMDQAIAKGENIYIPDDENAVNYEVIKADISPVVLNWRDDIRNKFYRVIGLPQIVPGGGGQSSESEAKVIYLAFEQIVKKEQRALELQLWNQLGLRITFNPPTSLLENLKQDEAKDSGQGLEFQPGDITPGVNK